MIANINYVLLFIIMILLSVILFKLCIRENYEDMPAPPPPPATDTPAPAPAAPTTCPACDSCCPCFSQSPKCFADIECDGIEKLLKEVTKLTKCDIKQVKTQDISKPAGKKPSTDDERTSEMKNSEEMPYIMFVY